MMLEFTDSDEWPDSLETQTHIQDLIALGIQQVHEIIIEQATFIPFDIDLILQIHHIIFHGVVPNLAGRLRGPAYSIRVHFANNPVRWGAEPDEVLPFLQRLVQTLRLNIERLETRNADDEQFILDLYGLAAWVQAEFIRIHPFRNGNGRVGRFLTNYILRRFGEEILPIERPAGEYFQVLNYYHDHRDFVPLRTFLMRVGSAL